MSIAKLNSIILIYATALSFSCQSGLIYSQNRNLREKIIVFNKSDVISESNIQFILELRNTSEEIALSGISDFLKSDKASQLSHQIKSEIIKKPQLIRKTLTQAEKTVHDSIIFTKFIQDNPFSDENLVLYLKGIKGYYLYFSYKEIDEIFVVAQERIQEDLETIFYIHPFFTSDILKTLKSELDKRNIKIEHASLSDKEFEKLKVLTAAGILETSLRTNGVKFESGKPLLQTNFFGKISSPQLTAVFQDQELLDQIKNSDETKITKSFDYLIQKNVINLK